MDKKSVKSSSSYFQEVNDNSWDSEDEIKAGKWEKHVILSNSLSPNIWDNSTTAKIHDNDNWDSESECQETLVVPFVSDDLSGKEDNNRYSDDAWDSESKEFSRDSLLLIKAKEKPVCLSSSCESIDEKEKSNVGESEKNGVEENLLIEDIEEVFSGRKSERSNNTIWMIPSSARTRCTTSLDEDDSDLNECIFRNDLLLKRKSKSYPKFEKLTPVRKKLRDDCSKSLECFTMDDRLLDLSLYKCLKSQVDGNKKESIESIIDDLSSAVDDLSPRLNEFQCYVADVLYSDEVNEEGTQKSVDGSCDQKMEDDTKKKNGGEKPGPSTVLHTEKMPEDVKSKPANSSKLRSDSGTSNNGGDLLDKKKSTRKPTRTKCREKPTDKMARNNNSKSAPLQKSGGAVPKSRPSSAADNSSLEKKEAAREIAEQAITESWIFLDESGRSRPVTIKDLNILLNGRSADAVLQEQKEHIFPRECIFRSASSNFRPNEWTPLVQKNIERLPSEEDVGGEQTTGRSIGLERKVGNMLVYIQSRLDLVASVRFISVDTETIHVWRQSGDIIDSSPIDSEADASLPLSQEALEERRNSSLSRDSSVKNSSLSSRAMEEYKRKCRSNRLIDLRNVIGQQNGTIETLTEDLKKVEDRRSKEQFTYDHPSIPNLLSSSNLPDVKRNREKDEKSENLSKGLSESSNKEVNSLNMEQESFLEAKDTNSTLKSKNEENDEKISQDSIGGNCELIGTNSMDNSIKSESLINSVDLQITRKETDVDFGDETMGKITAEKDSQTSKENDSTVTNGLECKRHDEDEENEVQVSKINSEAKSLTTSGGKILSNSCKIIDEIFEDLMESRNDLQEFGFNFDPRLNGIEIEEEKDRLEHELNAIRCYLKELTRHMIFMATSQRKKEADSLTIERLKLEDPVSEYDIDLTEVVEKEPISDLMDEYYRTVTVKTALSEEVNNLKAENSLLLESQIEQYDKLKQTVNALNEQKTRFFALENGQKLLEIEKYELLSKLKLYESERKELQAKTKEKEENLKVKMEELKEELREKEKELKETREKMEVAFRKCNRFEESSKMKDEAIIDLKNDKQTLENRDSLNICTIELLTEQMKNTEDEKTTLESELASAEESKREMSAYNIRLENLLRDAQEEIEKYKRKLKENNRSLTDFKDKCERLNDKRKSETSLCNQLKTQLEECKRKLEKEEEKWEKSIKRLENLLENEREKCRKSEKVVNDLRNLRDENLALQREKSTYVLIQEELVQEIKTSKKEIEKLVEKYRNVKSECNERTKLIKYLQVLYEKNMEGITNLEKSTSVILDKLAAYKNNVNLKNDSQITTLKCRIQESDKMIIELGKELENYFQMAEKLKKESKEKEKNVNLLSLQLLKERKKIEEMEKFQMENEEDSSKCLKLEMELRESKNKLAEYQKIVKELEMNREEKNKTEMTIRELKLENEKYRDRFEVMMKNLSSCGRHLADSLRQKRIVNETVEKNESLELKLRDANRKAEKKDVRIEKLNDIIAEMKKEAQVSKSGIAELSEELKIVKMNLVSAQHSLNVKINELENCQKEKEEMADKLLESMKLVMEGKNAHLIFAEKEGKFKEQIDRYKNELKNGWKELEEKRKAMPKLESKLEHLEDGSKKMASSEQLASQVDDKIQQLKKARAINLQLRKKEGELQTKIVLLEDEVRKAKLSIKEMTGDLKKEKKSMNAYKKIISSAKEEIEKCRQNNQLTSLVAQKINRHFDLYKNNMDIT